MSWTYPPRQILVPVDFGEASSRALRVAAVLAARFGADVDALHAEMLEAPPYFTHDQVTALERQRGAARAAAERYLREFARRQGADLRRAIVIDGPPQAAVLDAAGRTDLIVMGTHGRTGAARWWLGSVAERVARETTVPVIVVRKGEGDPASLFARILVVSPFTAGEGMARRYAHVLAGENGQVIDGTDSYVEDAARRTGATMLALPVRGGQRQWFGEQVEQIVRRSDLPLFFVPDEGGRKAQPAGGAGAIEEKQYDH